MPYIKKEYRQQLDHHIDNLINAINACDNNEANYLSHAGILNYCITKLGLGVIPVRQYWAIALKSGVFRNVADEFYRRYASGYEDEAIARNGDVYPDFHNKIS